MKFVFGAGILLLCGLIAVFLMQSRTQSEDDVRVFYAAGLAPVIDSLQKTSKGSKT